MVGAGYMTRGVESYDYGIPYIDDVRPIGVYRIQIDPGGHSASARIA